LNLIQKWFAQSRVAAMVRWAPLNKNLLCTVEMEPILVTCRSGLTWLDRHRDTGRQKSRLVPSLVHVPGHFRFYCRYYDYNLWIRSSYRWKGNDHIYYGVNWPVIACASLIFLTCISKIFQSHENDSWIRALSIVQ
jgi:hypothetical protein